MKGIFYVFSGTGNTDKVCRALADEWQKRGVETTYVRLQRGEPSPDPRGFDRVAVGYPVHAFNAPEPVLDLLKRWERADGTLLYFVKTSGEPVRLNDCSCARPAALAQKRGFTVAGEFHYVMPYNIIFRHSDGMAARMWQAALRRIPGDAAAMAEGKKTPWPHGPFKRAFSFALRIEQAAMPHIGRHFRATERCVGCGKCAKVCPQGNIRMEDGRPVFGKSCVGCMACAFYCPADAVKTGLLNGWRVNGAYSFEGAPAADGEICRYCNKAYRRYFAAAEALPPPAAEPQTAVRVAEATPLDKMQTVARATESVPAAQDPVLSEASAPIPAPAPPPAAGRPQN